MAETAGRVVFRVDGGAALASGHVMRCLTLAGELTRRGAQAAFVCRGLPGHLGARVQHEGYPLHLLDAPREGTRVPWQRDAEETRTLLERLRPDWLIVDHYGLDAAWERAQRSAVARVLVIDDLADRAHACDVLLDQNYFGAATAERYAGLAPAETRLLLGPHYALLRREYAAARAVLTPRTGAARRVLVFFGGSDSTDVTSKALQALSAPEFSHLAVDVVLGANHAAAPAVRALTAARSRTTLHSDLPSLASLMARADLAVGAGGTTTWERLCLELPSVVVTVAANQEQPTASLAAAGLVNWAGRTPAVSVEELRAAIASALRGPRHVRSIVDGYGAARVAAVVLPPSARNLRLLPAGRGDAQLLFDWRNDALARAMSFEDAVIDWDAHVRWLDATLADPDVAIVIGVVDGLPVGQARLQFADGEAELSYSVDPLVRRLGFGTALVEHAVRGAGRAPERGFRARVKAQNLASRRIFERLGWHATMAGADYVFRLAPGPGSGAKR